MNNGLSKKCLIFSIILLFVFSGISQGIGLSIYKIYNEKNKEMEIITDVIQTNKWNNHNIFYPNDSLDQFQIIWNKGIAPYLPEVLAQSFKPSENVLTRVELLISKIENPTDNLLISIRSSLNGSDIASVMVLPEEIPTEKEWVEFDFQDIIVDVGQTYYIVFTPQCPGYFYLWWGYDNHNFDSYPNGESWLYTNNEWSTENFVIKDWCFKTYSRHSSNPPDEPNTPSGPTVGITWTSYSYSTNTTDPDGDDVKYGWDWDGDEIVDEWTGFYLSGIEVNISHKWPNNGIYNITVKAEDSYGVQSGFSPKLTVIMSNDPPNEPNIPSGSTVGITLASYSYSTNTTDPDGDDVKYGWDWDGDGVVDEWTEFYLSGEIVNNSHIWNISGIYNIGVKAEDKHGAQSGFSPVKKIAIVSIDNDPPNKPDIPSGSTFCKVGISYSYSSSSTDPNGDRIYYMFDWDDGTNGEWIGPYNSDQIVSMSHIWHNKGTYNIKIKAKDEYGEESVWSDPLAISMPIIYNFCSSQYPQLLDIFSPYIYNFSCKFLSGNYKLIR